MISEQQYKKAVTIVHDHVRTLIQLKTTAKTVNPIIFQYLKVEAVLNSFVELFRHEDPKFNVKQFRTDCSAPEHRLLKTG